MKVLLADDSDLILERLKEMLASHKQVEIVAALKNGNETLEALRNLKPEIAIVDIKMPGMSGLKVVHEIRKENLSVQFIILTLYSSDYFRHLAKLAGTNYFFNKADDFEKVSLAVADIISRTRINAITNNATS